MAKMSGGFWRRWTPRHRRAMRAGNGALMAKHLGDISKHQIRVLRLRGPSSIQHIGARDIPKDAPP
jgi:hypothetical protein